MNTPDSLPTIKAQCRLCSKPLVLPYDPAFDPLDAIRLATIVVCNACYDANRYHSRPLRVGMLHGIPDKKVHAYPKGTP